MNYNDLIFISDIDNKPNMFVNIMGIIIEIMELKQLKNKDNLSLLNLVLADKSNSTVRIALWGGDAERFNANIGSVMIIYDGMITNYEGLTLSVVKKSMIYYVKEHETSEIIDDIRDWYMHKFNKNNLVKRNISCIFNENKRQKK